MLVCGLRFALCSCQVVKSSVGLHLVPQAPVKAALRPLQVLLVVVPGKTGAAALDDSGLQALSLLRQLGMPALIGVANGACPDEAANAAAKMKEKAAARKRAAAVLASEVCRGSEMALLKGDSNVTVQEQPHNETIDLIGRRFMVTLVSTSPARFNN